MFATFILLLVTAGSAVHGFDYTIVGAKAFRVGAVNNVVINLHGYHGTATVSAGLWTLPQRLKMIVDIQTQHPTNAPILIPFMVNKEDLVEARRRQTYVEMLISVSQSSHDFSERMPVLLNFTSGFLFLTTNRPVYRPDEDVNIVVAVLDQNLRSDKNNLVDIIVRTPASSGKIGVHKASNKTLSQGHYIEESFHIASEPLLGVWFVEASVSALGIKEEVSFMVKKYVLPTFNIRVQMDRHYILTNGGDITGTIYAEYSYGEKVFGQYFLFATLKRPNQRPLEVFRHPNNFTKRAYISNGREAFVIPKSAIRYPFEDLVREGATLVVEAAVTGDETTFDRGISKSIQFTNTPYVIVTDRSSKYFVPGLIYDAKVDVRDAVTLDPIANLWVTFTVGGTPSSIRTDDRGQFTRAVPTSKSTDNLAIEITTRDDRINDGDQATTNLNVRPLSGDAHIAISISAHGRITVGSQLNFPLRFEPDLPSIPGGVIYYVVSGGQVVAQDVVHYPANHQGDLSMTITVNQTMVPSARLVAYYIRNNDIVANSVWFEVENQCAGQELEVTLSSTRLQPQSTISVTVTGNPSAVFHMAAVDRASYFVYNGSRLTRDLMWDKMASYDTACSKEGGHSSKNVFEEAGLFVTSRHEHLTRYEQLCQQEPRRRKRQAIYQVNHNDRQQFLSKCARSGRFSTLTNETCADRKAYVSTNTGGDQECIDDFFAACQQKTIEGKTGGRSILEDVNEITSTEESQRSVFTENWIWITKTLGIDGTYKINEVVPGSISTFDFTTFSYSSQGFCVAKPLKATVFKTFFIQLYLPYSVRLLEQATIRYSLFNYRDEGLDVSVYLHHSGEICTHFKPNTDQCIKRNVYVPARSSVSYTFNVLPIKIPENPQGATISMSAGRDSLLKYLKIEPRGLLKENSKNFLLRPGHSLSFNFEIPTKFEPKSRQCHIYAYASPMGSMAAPGPSLQLFKSLKNLIRLPGGCGEQNIVRIAPSIYVYNYRKASSQVVDGGSEFQEIVANIQGGYQIQLGHRSDSVGKRAWAIYHHAQPSLWLNAFVDRVFTEAHEIWTDLDVQPICNSLNWILENQNDDGSFIENYRTGPVYYMGQVQNNIATTAYVAVTLAESESLCAGLSAQLRAARELAFAYIGRQNSQSTNDCFVLAITTYALAFRGNRRDLALQWNERLLSRATEDSTFMFWPCKQARSARIEITAYALLAQIKLAHNPVTSAERERARKIAFWLVTQRNSHGGFVSSQDTVMGLQATAEYMTWSYNTEDVQRPTTDLTVNMASLRRMTRWFGDGHQHVIRLNGENQLFRNELKVPDNVIGSDLEVSVAGRGNGSLSYRCTWREAVDENNCTFEVDAQIEDNIVKVTVSKPEGPPVNIAMIEVGILSGLKPIKSSIDKLEKKRVVDGKVDRYEITNNTVIFYIAKISSDPIPLYFEVTELPSTVANPQPAAVKVYDYYNPDVSCTKFYAPAGDGRLKLRCQNDPNLCKCLESGCVKCRTFLDIATNTTQISYTRRSKQSKDPAFTRNQALNTCQMGKCFDSFHAACSSASYLYYVKISEVMTEQTPGYVEFNATILHTPRKDLNDLTVLNRTIPGSNQRKFKMKYDCYTLCTNNQLTRSNVKLITPGQELIIYGSPTDISKGLEGAPDNIVYYLDDTATVEPRIPQRTCKKIEKWFNKRWTSLDCSKDKIMTAGKRRKCEKLRVCKNQQLLIHKVSLGCG